MHAHSFIVYKFRNRSTLIFIMKSSIKNRKAASQHSWKKGFLCFSNINNLHDTIQKNNRSNMDDRSLVHEELFLIIIAVVPVSFVDFGEHGVFFSLFKLLLMVFFAISYETMVETGAPSVLSSAGASKFFVSMLKSFR